MSIERKETCPTPVLTTLEIFQQTLSEARLTTDEALSAAAMLIGYVCLEASSEEQDAHDRFALTVYDVHQYIAQNWVQVQELRQLMALKRRLQGE